jgi:hypothetical protein
MSRRTTMLLAFAGVPVMPLTLVAVVVGYPTAH